MAHTFAHTWGLGDGCTQGHGSRHTSDARHAMPVLRACSLKRGAAPFTAPARCWAVRSASSVIPSLTKVVPDAVQPPSPAHISLVAQLKACRSLGDLAKLLHQCERLTQAEEGMGSMAVWRQLASTATHHTIKLQGSGSAAEEAHSNAAAQLLYEQLPHAFQLCNTVGDVTRLVRQYQDIWSSSRLPFGDAQRASLHATMAVLRGKNSGGPADVSDFEVLLSTWKSAASRGVQPGPIPSEWEAWVQELDISTERKGDMLRTMAKLRPGRAAASGEGSRSRASAAEGDADHRAVTRALQRVSDSQELTALLPQCSQALAGAQDARLFLRLWHQVARAARTACRTGAAAPEDNTQGQRAAAALLHEHAGRAIEHCQTPLELIKLISTYVGIWSESRVPFNDTQRQVLAAKLSGVLSSLSTCAAALPGLVAHQEQESGKETIELVEVVCQAGKYQVQPGPFPAACLSAISTMPGLTAEQRVQLEARMQQHNTLQLKHQQRRPPASRSAQRDDDGTPLSEPRPQADGPRGRSREPDLPYCLHVPHHMGSLREVADHMAELLAYLDEPNTVGGREPVLAPRLAAACEQQVAQALQLAVEMWAGEPLPQLQDSEGLSRLLSQTLFDGIPEAGQADTTSTSEDDEDDEPSSEEEEEEEQQDAGVSRAAQAERDEVLLMCAQLLARLGRNITPVGAVTVLWSALALGVRLPLGVRRARRVSKAFKPWLMSLWDCIASNWRVLSWPTDPSDGLQTWHRRPVAFLEAAEGQALVPSLMLGLHTCDATRFSAMIALASHSITHMATWSSAQARAALGSTMGRLQRNPELEAQLIQTFGAVVVAAQATSSSSAGDMQEEEESPVSLVEWIVNRTSADQRPAVLEMLTGVARQLPPEQTLLVVQLVLSHFGHFGGGEELDDDEREDLARFQGRVVASLSARTAVVMGVGPAAQDGLRALHCAKLVQLAEVNASQVVRVTEGGKHVWKANPDMPFMRRVCKAIQGRRDELDVPSLMVFARVLIATEYDDRLLVTQIIDDAGRRAKDLDADTLAECVLKQAEPGTPLSGPATTLFTSTMREAMGKRESASLTGLLTLLLAISRLDPKVAFPEHTNNVNAISDQIVAKLGSGTFEDKDQIYLAALAFNSMTFYHPGLLGKLCDAVASPHMSRDVDMQTLIRVLYTAAQLGPLPGAARLFEQASERIRLVLHRLSMRDVTLICWAYAVANMNPAATLDEAWLAAGAGFNTTLAGGGVDTTSGSLKGKMSSRRARAMSGAVTMVDLLAYELHARRKDLGRAKPSTAGSAKFAMRIWQVLQPQVKIEAALLSEMRHVHEKTAASKSQEHVFELLKEQMADLRRVAKEKPVGHNWVTDMSALHKPTGLELYFEVDGPIHFVANDPTRPLGSTTIRNLCLRKLLASQRPRSSSPSSSSSSSSSLDPDQHPSGGALVTLSLTQMPNDDRAALVFLSRSINDALIEASHDMPSWSEEAAARSAHAAARIASIRAGRGGSQAGSGRTSRGGGRRPAAAVSSTRRRVATPLGPSTRPHEAVSSGGTAEQDTDAGSGGDQGTAPGLLSKPVRRLRR